MMPTVEIAVGDDLDRRPVVREPDRFGIACIGSGNIMANAHLPSYAKAGYRVVGITSRTHAHAEATAEKHGLSRVYGGIDDLLRDPDVDVVDIALPPDLQSDVVMRCLDAGKHVLAQKPFGVEIAECEQMVQAAESRGVKLAVNQNGRFDPSINAAKALIEQGALGTRVSAMLTMWITMPWQKYYEDPKYDRLMILNMSVHHIDQFRWLFGDPISVWACSRKIPGQRHYGETIAQYTLMYEDGFLATAHDDGTDWSDQFGIQYRIQGTEGMMLGEIGWPRLTHSVLRIASKGVVGMKELDFSRMWFPDAFSATMGELLCAIEDGREPSNSGRDNLGTMRTVMAAYRSIDEGRSVRLDEVFG